MGSDRCDRLVCDHDAAALQGESKSFTIQRDLTGERTSDNTPWEVVVRRCCTGERHVVAYDADELEALLPPYELQGFDCSQIRAKIADARSMNRSIRPSSP
ncbi:MAG: hypothetical protein AB1689_14970 [Thermodesulfobacteriota bacterium]